MELEPGAPVVASGVVQIAAPLAIVWQLVSNIEDWPSWNPDVKWAHLNGELRNGSTIKWKAGPGTIRSRLTEVDEGSLIAWTGTTLGIRAVHIWQLSESQSRTALTTAESWSGLLPRMFKGPMKRTLKKAIDQGLAAVKDAAEARIEP